MSIMSMSNSIAVMGILAGGAIVTHMFDMRGQGSSYGAYDVVIDSYFYTFNVYLAEARTWAEEVAADRAHDWYKNECSNPPRRN